MGKGVYVGVMLIIFGLFLFVAQFVFAQEPIPPNQTFPNIEINEIHEYFLSKFW